MFLVTAATALGLCLFYMLALELVFRWGEFAEWIASLRFSSRRRRRARSALNRPGEVCEELAALPDQTSQAATRGGEAPLRALDSLRS